MKGKLELAIINQEKPRLNYTVFYNGHLCKINEINIDEVTIKDYFTNEEFILDLDFVKTIHVLFVVKIDKFTTLLNHKDIKLLINSFIREADDVSEFITKVINNSIDYYIQGNLTKVFTKPNIGNTIEIINLNIIDNNSLYNKEDRIFNIVDSYKSKHNKDVYKLENSKVNITAIREQFKLLSSIDYKEVFIIK